MTNKLFTREQLKSRDIDTLKRQLRDKIGDYGLSIKDLSTDNLLYRGVVCEERPNTIDRISYPPPEKVTKLGRLNRVGISMFYCSRGAAPVFYEIHAKPGDRIALSEWEIIEPLWMHHLGYHEQALHRIGAPMIGSRLQLITPIPNETRNNEKLRRKLSLAITENIRDGEEYKYKLSIAINELLFDGADPLPDDKPNGPRTNRAAGTVYPAMQMRGAADNIALWPEFVDRCLRVKLVRYILVEAADEEQSSYTLLTLAISNDLKEREIVWQDRINVEEKARRTYITFEDGNWVQRDGYHRIYDTH